METIVENQLGIPLYAAGRACVKIYSKKLRDVNLTYTQYLTLRILWRQHPVNVKTIGEILFLDSGTLTPVLKRLEKMGLITRTRKKSDDRVIEVNATEQSEALHTQLSDLPVEVANELGLSDEERETMYVFLGKILKHCIESGDGTDDD